jgi:hypothetical protein
MVAFYNAGDQELYKQYQYLPQEQYRLGLNLPKTEQDVEAVTSSFGIPNTNAFTNSGENKNYFSGSTNQLINNFNAINQDRYFNSLPTPNVDSLDQSIRDKTFMGMKSYNENQDVNPVDAGEYLAAGQDIPTRFDPTIAGRVQETLGKSKDLIGKGAGMAFNAAMGIPGLSYVLGKMDRFNTLSPLDQQYINQSKYYTGPTVFGENNSGLSKDPFGINTRSMFGNYAQYVRDLVASGKLKGDRKTFYEKEMEKQEQNKKVAIENERRAGAAANAGTQRGGGVGDSSTSHMGGISQSQADAVGKANKDAGMGGWGLRDGGRAGYFFGGRVNFKNGGLASIL